MPLINVLLCIAIFDIDVIQDQEVEAWTHMLELQHYLPRVLQSICVSGVKDMLGDGGREVGNAHNIILGSTRTSHCGEIVIATHGTS